MDKNTILARQFELSLARAAWWTAYANTPANQARIIHRGLSTGALLSPDELIDDAMSTADLHLRNAQGFLDEMNVSP